MSVPYQNKVNVVIKEPYDKNHTFTRIHKDAAQLACKTLSYPGFQLWNALRYNTDGYSFELS